MLELSLQTSFTTFCSRGTHYGTSSAATLLVEDINSIYISLLEIQENNSSKTESGGSLNKRLSFISNHYDYEMCCFKRKMSVPKRLMDSKAWCPVKELTDGILDECGRSVL